MSGEFVLTSGELPPIDPRCAVSVAIPARNEAERIEPAIEALTMQHTPDGSALDPRRYEVLVFANGCEDATPELVRRCARRHPQYAIHLIESVIPGGTPHVGTARRAVMNFAAARFTETGRTDGIVATTDADTRVAPGWIDETLQALSRADAVGGRILLDRAECARFDRTTQSLLTMETAYRFAVARLESLVDPLCYDPWPRHAQHFAGSLAVRASVYHAVGGMPPLASLEDVAFVRALERIDAPFRHSLRVRVTTSARRIARADGGLSRHLSDIDRCAHDGTPYGVEDPSVTLAKIEGRAALRRIWSGADDATPLDRSIVARTYALGDVPLRRFIVNGGAFGELHQRLEERAEARSALERPPMPVARARAVLERYARTIVSPDQRDSRGRPIAPATFTGRAESIRNPAQP